MEVLEAISRGNEQIDLGPDIVFLKRVHIQVKLNSDAWDRKDKVQPMIISAKIPHDILQAAENDDIAHTLDYRTIYKTITAIGTDADEQQKKGGYFSGKDVAIHLGEKLDRGRGLEITIEAPKAVLNSEGTITRVFSKGGMVYRVGFSLGDCGLAGLVLENAFATVAVKGLTIPCIIGIGEHERLQKQPVVVDFAFNPMGASGTTQQKGDRIFEIFEGSKYLTLEAFVTEIAKHLIFKERIDRVAVSAYKPGVFGMADGPGVQVVRSKADFDELKSPQEVVSTTKKATNAKSAAPKKATKATAKTNGKDSGTAESSSKQTQAKTGDSSMAERASKRTKR